MPEVGAWGPEIGKIGQLNSKFRPQGDPFARFGAEITQIEGALQMIGATSVKPFSSFESIAVVQNFGPDKPPCPSFSKTSLVPPAPRSFGPRGPKLVD